MNDPDNAYQQRSVKVLRGRHVRALTRWQAKGWEFVTEHEGRLLWTTLTFRRPRRTRRRRVAVTVGILALAGSVAFVSTNWSTVLGDHSGSHADHDRDGIPDRVESAGWRTTTGAVYRTDPDKSDTDGDGLTDGDEAGVAKTAPDSRNVYTAFSSPVLADTDHDG